MEDANRIYYYCFMLSAFIFSVYNIQPEFSVVVLFFLNFFFYFWHTYKVQNPTFFALSDKELYARGLKLMVITHALYMIFSNVGLGSAYEIFIFLCAIVLDLSIQFLKMFLSCSVPADFVVFPIQGPNQDPTEICVGH